MQFNCFLCIRFFVYSTLNKNFLVELIKQNSSTQTQPALSKIKIRSFKCNFLFEQLAIVWCSHISIDKLLQKMIQSKIMILLLMICHQNLERKDTLNLMRHYYLMQLTEDQVPFKQMASIFKDQTENSLRAKYRKLTSPKRKNNFSYFY